jgi:FRG domain
MRTEALNGWAAFESAASRMLDDFEKRRTQVKGYMSHPLFRGQANAEWRLQTTLERFSPKSWTVSDYFALIKVARLAVGSLTGRVWELPGLERGFNFDEDEQGPPPGYEFMIYLRHHGFPSPLLDWTRSPYVAAFFAFACRPHAGRNEVALYSFVEAVGQGKMWDTDRARIIGLGPTALTHERHYSQQCEYTICKKAVPPDRAIYASHEEALGRAPVIAQDILTKYVIPISDRAFFLRKLESMNIHHYSLFRDETALMQTLAYREIEKHEGP